MPEDHDMEDGMFDKIRHMLGGHKHKVVKSIKPTENEVLEMMTLRGHEENAKKAAGTYESMKKLFWAKVELRTGEVSRELRWNDADQKIEVVECDHSQKKLPESNGGGEAWED